VIDRHTQAIGQVTDRIEQVIEPFRARQGHHGTG
jgi:hypothetical protein